MRRAAWAFCACLISAELGLRLANPRFWQAWGRAELVSASSVADYSASIRPAAGLPQAYLLGDSVLYGTALLDQRIPQWRQKTVGQALRRQNPKRLWHEISAEGLLIPDLIALYQAAQPPPQAALVIELNYRMFSADAGQAQSAYSRPFLAPAYAPDWEDRLADFSAYYRYAQVARFIFWQPSREVRLSQWLHQAGTLPDSGADHEDLRGNLLAMKISPYYSAPVASEQHAGLAALKAWLPRLGQRQGPVLIFLTLQNRELIGDYLDVNAYAGNRKLLKNLAWPKNVAYLDWADRKLNTGEFLDHCHLNEQGNQELAAWIAGELP